MRGIWRKIKISIAVIGNCASSLIQGITYYKNENDAVKIYAECVIEAEVGSLNNIPVFIAGNPEWANKFNEKNLPIIDDNIKAQLGATITHRVLADLFNKLGVKLEKTYQLNTGGNTDFLNMLNVDRLKSKKESKTEAVQSVVGQRLDP